MPKWRNVQVEIRFWDKVQIPEDMDDCWPWTGGRHDKRFGYGSFAISGRKREKAHRYSFALHNPIFIGWEGVQVLHHCDNAMCVNPRHLYAGTNDDNVRDRMSRGRQVNKRGAEHWRNLYPEKVTRGEHWWTPKRIANIQRQRESGIWGFTGARHVNGEAHSQSKLTQRQVDAIRSRYIPRKVSQTRLAREYGVSRRTIELILSNRAWKKV